MDARVKLSLLAMSVALGCANGFGGGEDDDVNEDEASPGEDVSLTSGRTEGTVSVRYGRNAEDNFARGEEEFADENYLAAQKYFAYVKSKFPYSRLAVDAELRSADCLLKRERYAEAIDGYQNFIRLHPTHQKVGYATLMTGVAAYEQIPDDWFLIPASYEKDQSTVREAERTLVEFVERFPEDPSIKDGRELLKDVRLRLIRHERMVADFYRKIGKPIAYVKRLEVIRREYPEDGLDDALLVELAEAYLELGDRRAAEARVAELAEKFPGSPRLEDARRQLSQSGSAATQ